MTRQRNLFRIASALFAVLFLVLIVLLRCVDVQPIGPEGSEVGLSALNGIVPATVGTHPFWYSLTELLGLLALAVAACFGGLGLYQWIRRKRLLAVDRNIMLLAAIYGAVLFLYVLFELLVVNYRPILVDGALEASFPSSHTMLALVVFGTAIPQILLRIRARLPRILLVALCALAMALTAVGRLLSGVHWFTDILGAILLSAALVFLYVALLPRST